MLTRIRNRRGSVLPLAILVIAILAIGGVAGLMRVSTERRTTGNLRGEADALALAQAGLSRYLAHVTEPPPASLDTAIAGLPGGTDSIAVRLIRPEGGGLPALYVIRSSSLNTAARRFDAVTPPARRSIAQFAVWQPGTMNVQAAWASITGLTKKGNAGTIDGTDACGAAPPVAGAAVPTTAVGGGPGYDQNGGSPVPSGSPDIAYPGATPAVFAGRVNIDWNGIVNSGAITPDYALTGTSGWPSNFTAWPVILVGTSSLSLGPGNSGRGLLIVTGDLGIHGSFSWDGVVLVGGALTSDGNSSVEGAVVTGLNLKIGLPVDQSDLGNGTKSFQYNSCYVAWALTGLGSFVAIANAWLDNWPAY